MRGHKICFKVNGYTFRGSNGAVFILIFLLNPIAFRKVKMVYNFGLSECNKGAIGLIMVKSKN